MNYFYPIFFLCLLASCAKEFRNPYDSATPPDVWMPKAFKLDTLGTNALRLTWQQDELHIDGFAIYKTTNGQMKEILLPLDSLRFTDTQAVDTSSDAVCPELSYKVMARAGNNRSLEIGSEAIQLPFSTFADAGEDQTILSNTTQITLAANAPAIGETGEWSIINGSGGSFSNANSPTSTFTGNLCGAYTLRWSIQSLCVTTTDNLVVSFNIQTTQAQAGSDQSPTGLSILLNSNLPGANESGSWSIVSGAGGNFSNVNAYNSQFTGLAGNTYQLRWTITGSCSSSSDDMLVTFPANPTGISFFLNSCYYLNGISSLYYGLNGNSGPWGITSNGYSGNSLIAPDFNMSGQLSNALGTHYISFQQNFANSGYVEFWFNTFYGGSPNIIMPQVFIDDIEQSPPSIIDGQTTNGSWIKARTSVINSGSHTIKIQFTSQYYVLKVDEIECFQY